jgi:glycosyltransferase involved in cell wall biosynthesis
MRLAFILPRCGPEVLGGAETLGRAMAYQLARRGHHLEIWTTCAHSGWDNTYPPGIERSDELTLRRFPVEPPRPYDLSAHLFSYAGQAQWIKHQAHSPALYRYIANEGSTFDFLIFMPYLVGMTLHGATIYPDKSIIWPCLHDELFAYLAPVRRLLRKAAGIIFNTPAEQMLMTQSMQLEPRRAAVVGMGFESVLGDKTAFRQQHPAIAEQFFIYMGRLEPAKNLETLFQYFKIYQAQGHHRLDWVILGDGPLQPLLSQFPGVIHLGFVDDATKRNALAATSFLCQPSLNESFGIVLMEAWLQNKPVLIHEACPVTLDHVRHAQGGLYFATYPDFAGVVDYLLAHPDQAHRLGANGQSYVQHHYHWPVVLDRLEQALLSWLNQ